MKTSFAVLLSAALILVLAACQDFQPRDSVARLFDDSLGIAYTEDDDSLTSASEVVLWRRTAYDTSDNVIGSVYKLEGTGLSYEENQGSIGLYVLLSTDSTILGYALPEAEYGHSIPGTHHSNNKAFLDSVVGSKLSELSFGTTAEDVPDIVAGSTNTYTLLIGMLQVLNAIHQGAALQSKLDTYVSVLPGIASFTELDTEGDPGTIVEKVEAKDQEDNTLGYIVIANGTNRYGTMTIVLSVDGEGTILGVTFLTIEQTFLAEETRNNLALFVGTTLSDLTPAGDITTGATGSYNTMLSLLADIATAYGNLDILEFEYPDDPVATLFDDSLGIAYTEDDDSFTSGSSLVLWKKTAYDASDNVIGSVYKLEGTGVSYYGNEGSIGLYVLLSGDGTILGYALPYAEYGHTMPGIFHASNKAFLDSVVGGNLSDLSFSTEAGDIPDIITGSTNTYTLLITMLEALEGQIAS